MDGWNIIGDIHGDYNALMRLVDRMPKCPCISVGDMIDRGPQSKGVIEFFRSGDNRAVLGNHEHVMLDSYYKRGYYDYGLWGVNDAAPTIRSFGGGLLDAWLWSMEEELIHRGVSKIDIAYFIDDNIESMIPKDIIDWVEGLPLYIMEDGLFVSHAAWHEGFSLEAVCDLSGSINKKQLSNSGLSYKQNILWSLADPINRPGLFQVYGHHSRLDVVLHSDYGAGIDASRGGKLAGIHWPSMEVYKVDRHYEN